MQSPAPGLRHDSAVVARLRNTAENSPRHQITISRNPAMLKSPSSGTRPPWRVFCDVTDLPARRAGASRRRKAFCKGACPPEAGCNFELIPDSLACDMQNRVRLQIVDGPLKGRKFEFAEHDTFIFGRAPDCHAQLSDDTLVSRHHFILEVNPPLVRLRDLGSLNATRVNTLSKSSMPEKITAVLFRHGVLKPLP